jgi:hypothetical protein
MATVWFEETQRNVTSWRAEPIASLATALNCCVAPIAASVCASGLTSTVATTWLTTSDAEPDTPAVVAVIVAVPLSTAVTSPIVAFTVATLVADELHTNVCPAMAWPFASLAAALHWAVWPSATSVSAAEATSTLTTTWLTVRAAAPETPAIVAVIVAVPRPTAVTNPVELTVATLSGEEAQPTTCAGSVLLLASFATASNC